MAMEITENDAIDSAAESEPPKKSESAVVTSVTAKAATINVPEGAKATITVKPPAKVEGETGDWQMKVSASPEGDMQAWLDLISTSAGFLLDITKSDEDVMKIFKKNKVVFDAVKAADPDFFKVLMAKFTDRKNMFKKG